MKSEVRQRHENVKERHKEKESGVFGGKKEEGKDGGWKGWRKDGRKQVDTSQRSPCGCWSNGWGHRQNKYLNRVEISLQGSETMD